MGKANELMSIGNRLLSLSDAISRVLLEAEKEGEVTVFSAARQEFFDQVRETILDLSGRLDMFMDANRDIFAEEEKQ